MPASPARDPQQGFLALGLGHRPGQQHDVGALGRPAEHATRAEVAQQRGDRSVVLLREHLGGRQQRRLPAGVDGPQHRAQGHDRLAGSDLALEQPVHRVRLGQVVLDLGADLALARGELEGQPLVERRQKRPVTAGARHRPHGPDRAPASAQDQLGDQGLLEAEAALGAAHLPEVVGRVDPVVGGAEVEDVVLLEDRVGQRLLDVAEDGAREGDRALDVPVLDALGQGVEGIQVAEGLDSGDLFVVVDAEQRHRGVGELPLAAELVGLADEHALAADAQSASLPLGDALLLGEERHLQARTVGAEHRLQAVRRSAGPPVAVGLDLAACDLANNGQHLVGGEVVDLGELTGLEVAAREVPHQVTDRLDAEPFDDLAALALLVAQHRGDG